MEAANTDELADTIAIIAQSVMIGSRAQVWIETSDYPHISDVSSRRRNLSSQLFIFSSTSPPPSDWHSDNVTDLVCLCL